MMKDLVVLVADGQMEFTVRGLLTRGPSLQFRDISFDIWVHPAKDPGCLLRGHELLRSFTRQYAHAMVMHDREGCGRDDYSREALESEIESNLARSGWHDRAAAIVIDPELEVWVWSDSPEVVGILGWTGRQPTLAQWLDQQGHCAPGQSKPQKPKKAVDDALRSSGKRRSSSIFRQLAERVSVHRCTDPAFWKFKALLQQWFSKSPETTEER
ncbi:MAG: hypothetical protein ABR915_04980 [Thermoguttaceae bacterium]